MFPADGGSMASSPTYLLLKYQRAPDVALAPKSRPPAANVCMVVLSACARARALVSSSIFHANDLFQSQPYVVLVHQHCEFRMPDKCILI